MIAVIQRVTDAKVTVENATVGEIGHGLLILLGVVKGDTEMKADYLAEKIVGLRIFDNDEGKFDKSLLDVEGEALVVSQFTLAGSWKKGKRPGFDNAAPPDLAAPLVDYFIKAISALGIVTSSGVFGAHMEIDLTNDGPVTFVMDTK